MTPFLSIPRPKVIALDDFRPALRQTPLRQVEAYWTALVAEGDLPARSRIDPRALENVLEHVMILERIAPGIAKVRIAGACLAEAAGMEPRGLPLSALFSAGSRGPLGQVLEAVFDRPATAECDLRCGSVAGRMNLLPLRCDAGRISRALGAIAFDAPLAGQAPVIEIVATRMRPVYLPATEEPLRTAAEAPAPFTPAPHLRVVSSSD